MNKMVSTLIMERSSGLFILEKKTDLSSLLKAQGNSFAFLLILSVHMTLPYHSSYRCKDLQCVYVPMYISWSVVYLSAMGQTNCLIALFYYHIEIIIFITSLVSYTNNWPIYPNVFKWLWLYSPILWSNTYYLANTANYSWVSQQGNPMEILSGFPTGKSWHIDFLLVQVQLFATQWISSRKSRCQDFPVGNSLRISMGFPLDFLAGKLKNAGSVG